MTISDCKRVLFKVSGEALMGDRAYGHDYDTIRAIASCIKEVYDLGIQICIVIGGGNICRGSTLSKLGIERSSSDYMGMLATVINGIALHDILTKYRIDSRVQSSIEMNRICEQFTSQKAKDHIKKNRVVIFTAGMGEPFFSTDTAAVLRAIEMDCNYLFKATNVDGVYDSDPKTNPNSKRYNKITYTTMLKNDFKVMDMAAIAIARENDLPIKVFSIKEDGCFLKALQNKGKFTTIRGK